jgi:hypothetical protein
MFTLTRAQVTVRKHLVRKLTRQRNKRIIHDIKVPSIYYYTGHQFVPEDLNYHDALNIHHFTIRSYGLDEEWLNETSRYMQGLDQYKRFTLLGYTHIGDVYVNSFIRGEFDTKSFTKSLTDFKLKKETGYFPLGLQALAYLDEVVGRSNGFDEVIGREVVEQYERETSASGKYKLLLDFAVQLPFNSFWKHVLQRYAEDLEDIINNAPKLKKAITVFRGVKDDFFTHKMRDYMLPIKGFVSTSLHVDVAHGFTNEECCLKRITLLPGTACLFIGNMSFHLGEFEVLLGPRNTFYYTKESAQRAPIEFDPEEFEYSPNVVDVVVLPGVARRAPRYPM